MLAAAFGNSPQAGVKDARDGQVDSGAAAGCLRPSGGGRISPGVSARVRERRPVLHDRERAESPRLQGSGGPPVRAGGASGVLVVAATAGRWHLFRERSPRMPGHLPARRVQVRPESARWMQLRGACLRSGSQQCL